MPRLQTHRAKMKKKRTQKDWTASPLHNSLPWAELEQVFPSECIVLARELTKKFEEFLRGSPSALLDEVRKKPRKGEFVVLVSRDQTIPGPAPVERLPSADLPER